MLSTKNGRPTRRAGVFVCGWMMFSTKDRPRYACLSECMGSTKSASVWMVFSTKDRHTCIAMCVDNFQHQGQTYLSASVWMVFNTKDRHTCLALCVDSFQHQGQAYLSASVCGWCSAPRTGVTTN
ncbi:hypothetical protein Bbelb_232010 [Branchiostoma belcheri]|nr:hypothetical protein Bbelb_232010 [Branchiostoma belcheri]